ncbi:MAG: hypothetical protein ING61_14890 [Rhodocyclaceae bacterium]|nr:hypothetical protein [Rhodocyclaceae bacterium]MCA3694285.1 hypothetical protein [Aquidulcibacter sp.]
MKFHIDGTLPTGQQIFVFGSNLAGVHGAAMPLDRIEPHIKVFLDFAASCTDEFFVTRIGCGLAGYQDAQIAPLFKGAPPNCSFANQWRRYL